MTATPAVNATVLGKDSRYAQSLSAVREVFPDKDLTVEGGDHDWEVIYIENDNHDIKLTSRKFQEPQDPFSNMILGLFNFFKKTDSLDKSLKQSILNFIGECDFAIGVVSYTEFTQEGLDLLYKLTQVNQGMIFTGSAMLNAHGQLLLDQEGNSEV